MTRQIKHLRTSKNNKLFAAGRKFGEDIKYKRLPSSELSQPTVDMMFWQYGYLWMYMKDGSGIRINLKTHDFYEFEIGGS